MYRSFDFKTKHKVVLVSKEQREGGARATAVNRKPPLAQPTVGKNQRKIAASLVDRPTRGGAVGNGR